MITPITATFPALNFPKEVDYPTQEDWAAFSAAAELNYGILSGEWSDKSEEFKTQANNLALEIQAIGENAINAITFDNIAQLKLNSNIGRVDVLGYYTKGDGGGGIFYWDATSTEADNGGTIIQATGIATGRWKRADNNMFNVKQFGAKGDGATDDSVAFQNAISLVKDIFIPNGEYFINSNISISNQKIYGEKQTIIKFAQNLLYGFSCGSNSVIENLNFYPQGNLTADSCDINLIEGADNIIIQNCVFDTTINSGTRYYSIKGADFGSQYTTKVSNVRILNSYFRGYQRQLFLNSLEYCVVDGNTLTLSLRDAIRTQNNSKSITITNNTFLESGKNAPTGETADGIDANVGGENLIITGNRFIDCWVLGVDLKGYSSTNDNKTVKAIISNNEFNGCGLGAISAYSVDDLTGFATWPYAYDLIITGNIITNTRINYTGNDSGCIWIKSGYKGVTISNNIITSNRTRGIFIQTDADDTVDKARVSYVNIDSNIIFNNYTYGIHATDVKYLTVVGNQIGQDVDFEEEYASSQAVGLKIITTNATAVGRNNIISNNQFKGNTSEDYQIDSMNVIKVWANNQGTLSPAYATNSLPSFVNGKGQLLFGNGVRPSSSFGTFENSVIVNMSSTLAVGDYLFLVKLADGNWGKTGQIVAF